MPKRKKRKKIEHGAFTKLASFTSSAIKDYKHKQKLKQQQLEKDLKKQEFSKLSLEKKELRAKEDNFRKQEEKLQIKFENLKLKERELELSLIHI